MLPGQNPKKGFKTQKIGFHEIEKSEVFGALRKKATSNSTSELDKELEQINVKKKDLSKWKEDVILISKGLLNFLNDIVVIDNIIM